MKPDYYRQVAQLYDVLATALEDDFLATHGRTAGVVHRTYGAHELLRAELTLDESMFWIFVNAHNLMGDVVQRRQPDRVEVFVQCGSGVVVLLAPVGPRAEMVSCVA